MRVKAQQEILVGCSKRITLKTFNFFWIEKFNKEYFLKGRLLRCINIIV